MNSIDSIVVGVDGSAESRAALSWAADEARVRRARLRVVHAWTIPPLAVPSFSMGSATFPSTDDIEAFQEAARKVLDDEVASAIPADSELEVEKALVQEFPAQALVRESEHADLLVVGSRGHGGFAGLLLGSVGQHCAHHAACPVVIVRNRAG